MAPCALKTGPDEVMTLSWKFRFLGGGDNADKAFFSFARGVAGRGAGVSGRSDGPRLPPGGTGDSLGLDSHSGRGRPRCSSLHGLEPMGNGAGPLFRPAPPGKAGAIPLSSRRNGRSAI